MFFLSCAMCTSVLPQSICATKPRFCTLKKFKFITDIEITTFRDENQEIRIRFKVKTFILIQYSNYSCSLKIVFAQYSVFLEETLLASLFLDSDFFKLKSLCRIFIAIRKLVLSDFFPKLCYEKI